MNKLQQPPRNVGVVIPAFNEARNLHRVLHTLCGVNWLAQIVVADDGSSDGTLDVAERYAIHDSRVLALRSPQNQGKAAAMLFGVRALQTDTVIFLDADLINLHPYHLWQLFHPVETGVYEMTLAVFRHGGFLTDASHRLAPNLSGQRCLSRQASENILKPLTDTRYGVEVGLTVYAKHHKWAVKKIIWPGVTHVMKEQKRKGIAGLYQRRQMYGQIMTVWFAAQKPTLSHMYSYINRSRTESQLYETFKS